MVEDRRENEDKHLRPAVLKVRFDLEEVRAPD